MTAAEAIMGTLLVSLIGWVLYHNSQCNRLRERVAALEEWKRQRERE